MNHHDFDYYLKWNDERFKNKWDIVKYNEFQSYYGGTSHTVEGGDISFQPTGLELIMPSDERIFIPIAECKKIFESQGKQVIIQERLF